MLDADARIEQLRRRLADAVSPVSKLDDDMTALTKQNGAALALKSRDVTWSGGNYEFNGDAPAARIAALLGGVTAIAPVKEDA